MMRLTIKLFGPQAAAAACDTVEVELDDDKATCRDLRLALAQACPAVAQTLDASRFAVNCELVDEDHPVEARDEIALIGMVSGG
ncbi:MoaD/ThiS family protein [Planctomycetales bacterium ZRK34]|nr:MoaD/ThiS family protein [Planctomycetales bacterium ZRK34]